MERIMEADYANLYNGFCKSWERKLDSQITFVTYTLILYFVTYLYDL